MTVQSTPSDPRTSSPGNEQSSGNTATPRTTSPDGGSPDLFNVAINNWLRGFFVGYAVETVPALVGLLLPKAAQRRREGGVGALLAKVLLRSDAVPLGTFMGLMSASYPLAKHWIGRAIGSPDHPLAALGAGAVAFSAIGFDSAPHGLDRRVTFALYLLVRAAESFGESLVDKGLVPFIPHMDTILFQLSCTEIMYSWFYTPHTLPRAYTHWITKMAMMDTRLLEYLRAFREGKAWYGHPSSILDGLTEKLGMMQQFGDPAVGFCPCVFVHPECGMSCQQHTVYRFWITFMRAFVLYLPVHTVPSLLFRFNLFRSNPLSFLVNNLLASSRSAAFLGVFVSSIYTAVCLVRNQLQNETIYGPLLGSFLCGFSLLIEKKSRRMELALYCVPRALYSIYLKQLEAGRLPQIKHFDLFLFALSGAALMYFAEHEPKTIRPSILSLMRWFFDLPRPQKLQVAAASKDAADLDLGASSSSSSSSSSAGAAAAVQSEL